MSMLGDAYTLHEIGLATGADIDLERDIRAAVEDLQKLEGLVTREQAEAISARLTELREMRRPEFVEHVEKLRAERMRAAA